MTDEEILQAAGLSGNISRQSLGQHLFRLRDAWMKVALSIMEQEMVAKPVPGEPNYGNPDWYTSGPNVIGLAMLDAGFHSLASELFERAWMRVVEYRKLVGDHRHVGALVAHEGIAHGLMGDLDSAAICLLLGAEEDKVTHGTPSYRDTYGYREIWIPMVQQSILDKCLQILQTVVPTAIPLDIIGMLTRLGEREFVLLLTCHNLFANIIALTEFENDFSKLRVVGGLRDLAALIEITLKDMVMTQSSPPPTLPSGLFDSLQTLYQAKVWWNTFKAEARDCGTMRGSGVSSDEQVRQALNFALPPGDADAVFWKSLIAVYAVRNYTTHEMDIGGRLVNPTETTVIIAHFLNVLIYADARTRMP